MAIGERIRFFRNLRGMTQKYLGQMVGFPEKTADIRMAQYESGSRTPKAELTENLAGALGVSPLALSVPDIDSYLGLMHTLFTLEDRYGLTVETGENGVSLRVDPRKGKDAAELFEMLTAWAEQAEKYRNGEINREDYDKWRYNYPKYDEASSYVKIPSQQLSDALVDEMDRQLRAFIAEVERESGLQVALKQVSHYPAAPFDAECQQAIADAAQRLGYPARPIVSGAGHDAVYMSYLAPTGMIFIPCKDGISHNEIEYASPEHVAAGANVLLQVMLQYARPV